MMRIEVESKEIIKPSSPTPNTLKSYKLSLVDQLALNFKVEIIFFYHSSSSSSAIISVNELKKSLSKTLCVMYPLAGRVKEDKLTIECNDEGVEFIVANVAETLSCFTVPTDPMTDQSRIRQMIPTTGAYVPSPEKEALVAIQVNRFRCGGMGIGLAVSHAIADGAAIATFMKTWATINRGCTVNRSGFISDHSRIFPPLANTRGIERSAKIAAEAAAQAQKNYTVRSFIFPANAIAQLREQLQAEAEDKNTGGGQRLSGTEALTAFVWAAVINASHPTVNVNTLSCIVNLRSRMDPPLPSNCLGNLVYGTTVKLEATKELGITVTAVKLVRKIRDSIRGVNDGVARKMYGEGGLLRGAFRRSDDDDDDDEKIRKDVKCLYTSSLCGLPFYEADFGWGKPRWVVNALKNWSVFFQDDAINGGVQVWMGLPNEVMHALLRKNPHFLAYVSPYFPSFPKSNL